ncbi:hypothetical protein G9A89_019133 [Geosiphon pyriformis]|nr:hypothetical protein G9A89_019133 [Geosiphon pyriformis]
MTIPPAVATKDSSLTAIFSFELEENKAMFSGAALDKKCPITAMYMEATVNNIPIKLILDSGSAKSIIMLQLVNQLGFKVDCAVTSQIITADGSTKLPHGKIDSFPFKINGIVIPTKVLTTQELLINYNGHQARIPATCGHFQKPSANQRPTFEFEENPALPAIKTYQFFWTDDQKTRLPAILIPKLECLVCKKKLSSMTACSAPNKDPRNPTHYYCNRCNKEKYSYPKRHGKWNAELCLACGEPLPRGCRGGMCDATCQYTIFISAFNRMLKRLQHYSHDEDELYNTAHAKIKEETAKEIQRWKELAEVANEVASYNMFNPQEQYLAQINTYLCKNCLIPYQNQCCEECQDKKNLEKKMEIENQQSQNQSINQQDSPDGPKYLGIIPERVHPTDAKFDLYYLEDQSTMLPPRSITKIDLKIVVEIPPEIMSYIIESKEKITQAIFLLLVKIGKFVLVENHEKLSQTMREIFGFESTEKKIEANFAKTIEEKNEVIKTEQSIMLLPYGKSEIKIKRTIKEKDLIFEPYPETCQQFLIGLTNFFIPVDKAQWIKISITNTTEKPVYILEDTIIGYLETELENALTPQEILNFLEIALYCELTSIN